MSMSTSVQIFRPVDEKWHEMKAAWDACHQARVALPTEVEEFFEGAPPNEIEGVLVGRAGSYGDLPPWAAHVGLDMQDGFDVDVTKLPKDVKVVRFLNSY